MNRHIRALIAASGLCLTEHLTEEILESSDANIDAFIRENVWEPYENQNVSFIWNRIEEIAQAIEDGVK
jgi:CRISPR/Cas system-associated protein Cas10 (large subunit of type III CRISPR-Cas system)